MNKFKVVLTGGVVQYVEAYSYDTDRNNLVTFVDRQGYIIISYSVYNVISVERLDR